MRQNFKREWVRGFTNSKEMVDDIKRNNTIKGGGQLIVVINNKEIIDVFKRLAAAVRYNENAYIIYNDDFIDFLDGNELMKLASEWLDGMKQDGVGSQFMVGWKINNVTSVEEAIRILQANGFDVLEY